MAFGKEKRTTLEMVRKAYEELDDDDKEAFHQSIADRVHESVAAQERAEGEEDSQTAEDREHEALGAEHADERRDEEPEEEEEHREEEQDEDDRLGPVMEELAALRKELDAMKRSAEPAERSTADKLSALEKRFNN